MADLLLKGGEVSDLSQNVRAMLDVAVTDGVISAVAPDIDPSAEEGYLGSIARSSSSLSTSTSIRCASISFEPPPSPATR